MFSVYLFSNTHTHTLPLPLVLTWACPGCCWLSDFLTPVCLSQVGLRWEPGGWDHLPAPVLRGLHCPDHAVMPRGDAPRWCPAVMPRRGVTLHRCYSNKASLFCGIVVVYQFVFGFLPFFFFSYKKVVHLQLIEGKPRASVQTLFNFNRRTVRQT